MRRAHGHRFQVLTNRAERLAALSPECAWPTNVWMGVSVEKADNHRALGLARPVGSGPGGDPSPWAA